MTFALKKLPSLIVLGALLLILTPAVDAVAQNRVEVIVQYDGPPGQVRQAIEALGGVVKAEYTYLGSMLVDVSTDSMEAVKGVAGVKSVGKNTPIQAPELVWPFGGRGVEPAGGQDPLTNINSNGSTPITDVPAYLAALESGENPYLINHAADNVRELHAGSEARDPLTGSDVVVAVIDSGLRPGFGHFDTTLVECQDFVFDGNGCVDSRNDGHGTMVAGIIASAAEFHFSPNNVFLQSVISNAPGAVFDRQPNPALDTVAMIGSAPDASIYAFRVFGNTSGPSDTATILTAVNRIIELKIEEDVNIRVANFSLGRRTIYAGLDDFDQAFERLLAEGIVPVVSIGNAGPALLTTASPASAFSAIAVGAGSLAHQDRIVGDVGFFNAAGAGNTLRPFSEGQTAWFSSRGPNADGRQGPSVMSEGFGVYGAGLANQSGNVSLGIGSSFAAPNVAGIAALLWQDLDENGESSGYPAQDATRIRNAIVENGNSAIIIGGNTANDQGNGWVDASKALLNLATADDELPSFPLPASLVRDNIDETVVGLGEIAPLQLSEPGDRQDVIYAVLATDAEITVSLSRISATMCPAEGPDPFFGNELQLAIHTVKTSTVGPAGQYYNLNPNEGFEHAFIGQSDLDGSGVSGVLPGKCSLEDPEDPESGACFFDLVTPEPGLLRVSVSSATTNACGMSTDVAITLKSGSSDGLTLSTGTVQHVDTVEAGSIVVSPGDQDIEFELSWDNDWTHYPANDLELLIFMPGFPFPLPFGQTLDAPEQFVINSEILTALLGAHQPVPLPAGEWTIEVQGFEVNTTQRVRGKTVRAEDWELRVLIDGVPQVPDSGPGKPGKPKKK